MRVTEEENTLSDIEQKFLEDFNKTLLKYPSKNKGQDVMIFSIKPIWCIQNKLLIVPILFHPLNCYYKNYKEETRKFSHKLLIQSIIEWELNDNRESFLNTKELEQLISFFRNIEQPLLLNG